LQELCDEEKEGKEIDRFLERNGDLNAENIEIINVSRESEQYVSDHGNSKRYPVKWRGHLALKSCQADVEMRYLSGNDSIAMESLPQNIDYLRIFQRMGLRPLLLEPVERKLQPSFSLHIFPPCEFTNTHIRIPEELQEDNDPYLIIVITTV
ncbi:hypothetical protein NPIL_358091, partial [Nephila pilipes]